MATTKSQSNFTFDLKASGDTFECYLVVDYVAETIKISLSEPIPTDGFSSGVGDLWLARLDLIKSAISFGQTELTT